ncbi:hypothetical protein [Halorubrum kocurii]|uniref:DNA-3-methyladenine glycosylase 2 family protein n=1 Tax=Halorubrum kocurii JCM 14978 TaxID=1230456 RepID=M0NSB8_9EURY|nr:hypothetical protein [Halorubrum kocurii]EMA59490.1 hypothetical protein C468_14662 [Halorubrum kocurii JCM 14978]
MELSLADVEDRVADHVEAYRESAPFHPVEAEAIESLPGAFRAGEYGKRDVEWVVRWYFRRAVTDIDHEERRAVEAAVSDADPRELRGAMWDAIDALDGADSEAAADSGPPHRRALDALTRIPGVDVGVASALLWFLAPDEQFVVGEREWAVVAALAAADDLGPDLDEYPEPMTVDAYGRYLDAVRGVADRLGVDHWRLYMVIRRVHAESVEGDL